MTITCAKNVNEPCRRAATEFLLTRTPQHHKQPWTATPRCGQHPAAADIPVLRKVYPGIDCLVLPIPEVTPVIRLTTRQIEQRALAIPCPFHKVAAGQPCPIRPGALGGACMPRREAAEEATASA